MICEWTFAYLVVDDLHLMHHPDLQTHAHEQRPMKVVVGKMAAGLYKERWAALKITLSRHIVLQAGLLPS